MMSESLRLFLIEDEDDIALLITRELERAGHQVTRCRSAADAIICLGQGSYDLVLLDHHLPDMAGLQLLEELAREGIGTPCLMVTGQGDERLATRVLRAGALDYIVKDRSLLFLNELAKRVEDSVTRHRLEHTNRLLVQALESARDGVLITDLQGGILHVNQALEAMTGYSREELRGQTPRIFKSGRHAPEVYASLWRTVLARRSWVGELINRRKDGSLVEVSLTVSPMVDNSGQMTHFVGIFRDITDHKLLERQLLQAQKMQSVGTLAGGVAHEFNNLLAGINGYAALGLREPGLVGPLREFLQNIVSLSERAAHLTKQMLAFARKPTLLRQPTRMEDLVRASADLIGQTLHIGASLDVQPEARTFQVAADPNQLQQALVNLALNARDASTPQSPITFRLRRCQLFTDRTAFPETVPPGDYVVLEVIDRGSGMPPDVLSQALDPFFTTKDVGKGTGLGLPVVFGIVRGHQGYLTIDTELGRGTCVGIWLPRLWDAAGSDHRRPEVEIKQVVEPEQVPGRTILVVDDEEAVLDVVRRFLEIAGHRVTCACSGEEALGYLGNGQPCDLAILDLMMPNEDGASTFERLRQRRPSLPILLCTGLLDADPAPQLLRSGPVNLLRKPFRMNELWYAVNQALATTGAEPVDHRRPVGD
jgi:PAS domain S-box-containing protein